MSLHKSALCTLAGPAVLAVVLSTGCSMGLPSRPASLDKLGVRLGAEWLQQTTLYEDTRLGSVTQIVKRTGTGETAIVGTGQAVFLPGKGGTPRVATFAESAGHAELIEWPDGRPRYLDRGGGGWQTGGLIGADGVRLWQPDRGQGMDDLAAGDLDGDGVPEFVVGYNGGGGIRLLDAAGKERWRQGDGNVWHVEIVDTDGDGKPEIVHSNAAGQMTIRDASGKVLRRQSVEPYFSGFSLVQWPPHRIAILHAVDDNTDVLNFDGKVTAHLETPDTTTLGDVQGAATRLDGAQHLIVTASESTWDRTQLFVVDHSGVLRYREVFAGDCLAVAAPEPEAFLFGCGSRVLRYTTTRSHQ